MKLPKSIRIGGHKILIKVADLENLGEYHSDIKTIKINASIVADDKECFETLRHEMMHCALDVSGLSFCDSFEEESIVRCMDNVFFPAYDKLLAKLL